MKKNDVPHPNNLIKSGLRAEIILFKMLLLMIKELVK